jgi:hypothetical protein
MFSFSFPLSSSHPYKTPPPVERIAAPIPACGWGRLNDKLLTGFGLNGLYHRRRNRIVVASIFQVQQRCPRTRARTGILSLRGCQIETPIFMPVGTRGTVKAMLPEEVSAIGYQLILGNTFHLELRPGSALIERLGGLHRFMNWPHAILTDSGGFQVYSLSGARKIAEEGVTFRSHLDGSARFIGPETSMEIQQALGADVIMAFDECPPAKSDRAYLEPSLDRTTRWARRCRAAWDPAGPSNLFGIVQGGLFPDLRCHGLPNVSEMTTPVSTSSAPSSPRRSRAAEASGSSGSRMTVPCGALDESTPAFAQMKPWWVSVMSTP